MTRFDPPRYAVVSTHDRPAELDALVRALFDQCDFICVIDNASDPPVAANRLAEEMWGVEPNLSRVPTVCVIRDEEQPPNLSRLWNVGLSWCATNAKVASRQTWDVAVFNDDAIVPSSWYDTVAEALRSPLLGSPRAVAHTHTYGEPNRAARFADEHTPMELWERMCPWALVTRGELGLRYDEDLRWWFGDTAFEVEARKAGGVLAVPGPQVVNSLANQSTVGVLAEQAGRDRATFERKYGPSPW